MPAHRLGEHLARCAVYAGVAAAGATLLQVRTPELPFAATMALLFAGMLTFASARAVARCLRRSRAP